MDLSTDLTDARAKDLLDRFRMESRGLLSRFRIPAQDAEDLLQDTFLLLLRRRPEGSEPERWLQGALRNRCLVYWRERRRQFYRVMDTALLDALAQPTRPSQEHRVFLHDVLRRVGELPANCRALLSLRYRSDYRPIELADRLGYSRNGIYKILERCVAALSKKLLATPRGRA